MAKFVKHRNMLQPNLGLEQEGYEYFHFVCRGCTMRGREDLWNGFCSSIGNELNRSIDNSFLSLEEEPSNRYDPNAVQVVCRGEFFGTMGYVGKEFAPGVKEILEKCSAYRVDMINATEAGQREVRLLLTWKA